MRQMQQAWTVVTVVVLGWSVGCGGGPAGTESPAQAPPAAAAQAPSTDVSHNACALVDREALEALAGQKLDMLNNVEDDEQTVCELSAASDGTTLIYVTVHWSGGKEAARINSAAMGMARQLLNEPDVDIDKLTGSADVPGLADQAFYSNVMPSWVLKDDVLIEIISPRFGGDQTKAVFMAVATTALSRL